MDALSEPPSAQCGGVVCPKGHQNFISHIFLHLHLTSQVTHQPFYLFLFPKALLPIGTYRRLQCPCPLAIRIRNLYAASCQTYRGL
jgi:hypothetical protein